MGQINIADVAVAGPDHPSFGLTNAWFLFGVFSSDGTARRLMMVEAENHHAVHMLESLMERDGTVSATCGLLSVASDRPQIRSTMVEAVEYADFVIDMVEPARWLDSPFLIELFRQSLSEVDRINAEMKIDAAIRLHEWEEEQQEEAEIDESDNVVECDENKLNQLSAGLCGMGFLKHEVRKFVDSVRNRPDSVQSLLVEGIKQLNRD